MMMTTTTTTKHRRQQQQQQQQRLLLSPRCLLSLLILVSTFLTCQSFTTTALPTLEGTSTVTRCSSRPTTVRFLSDPENQNERDSTDDNNNDNTSDILSRFISPVIDDPALPLSDVLVAQIIAPSIQVVWLSLNHAPAPSWLRPIFDMNTQLFAARGSLVAPALIHGAALASCWIVGALAAKSYERAAIAPTEDNLSDYGTVLWRVVQAGAFATGVLILATQADLLLEYKGQFVQPGESPEIDLRLLTGTVEVINDVFFEAVCLVSWRLFLARQTATGSKYK